MPRLYYVFCAIFAALLFYSCGKPRVPAAYETSKECAEIYPDYTNIVIPPNIAPLNFIIKETADEYIVTFKTFNGKTAIITQGDRNKAVKLDETEWKNILAASKGHDITVSIYAKEPNRWIKYSDYILSVANESIDPYVSYRLIEPGYELYRQVGLYQRNLTNFDVKTIYENNREFEVEHNHCVNCHNYQNYSTKSMLFHVRGKHGGTIVAKNGKIEKLNMKSDSILSAAVYPTWHPKLPYIVFSSNKTGQVFHLLDRQKIEVLDWASDLIFYDTEKHTVRNILKTRSQFETFPCWASDGKNLYYTCADVNALDSIPDSLATAYAKAYYQNLRYNVMSIPFDESTQTFGTPKTEVDCAAQNKSASVPRISPDGRYLLFTLGDYGQFHIWHRSADLYIKDLQTGNVTPLTQANSQDTESYHAWSSNGRWIIFTSRRDDGSFTRLYITYFDKNGKDHKAFIIPQCDPQQNIKLMKSYNVPEMTRDAVSYAAKDFREIIYESDGNPIVYKP